jgi:HAD superfamily phosphatase (TIGR01668 family)
MKPERVYKDLTVMPWKELYDEGIRTALLDFDNTLGPDHATEPEDFSYKCVKMIEDTGIRCCLVSNAKSGRSAKIAEMLGIPVVTYANKPGTSGVLKAIKLMDSSADKSLMVGDQVFTDVIAGNRSGVRTFMVEKLHKQEIWYVLLKRPFEKLVRLVGKF